MKKMVQEVQYLKHRHFQKRNQMKQGIIIKSCNKVIKMIR